MSTGEDLTSAIDPYMSGLAFGGSILWRAFELSPTAFCCYTATMIRLLQRNIAGILPWRDTMCAEHCKLLGGDMFFVVDPALYWLCQQSAIYACSNRGYLSK